MDREQPWRRLQAHLVDDECTPVTALGHIALIAEALHQHVPGLGHTLWPPACRSRLAGKAEPGHRRDNDVERVLGFATVGDGIRQRADQLDLLENGAWPAMG